VEYPVSKLYVLVKVFESLRSLPAETHIKITWTDFRCIHAKRTPTDQFAEVNDDKCRPPNSGASGNAGAIKKIPGYQHQRLLPFPPLVYLYLCPISESTTRSRLLLEPPKPKKSPVLLAFLSGFGPPLVSAGTLAGSGRRGCGPGLGGRVEYCGNSSPLKSSYTVAGAGGGLSSLLASSSSRLASSFGLYFLSKCLSSKRTFMVLHLNIPSR